MGPNGGTIGKQDRKAESEVETMPLYEYKCFECETCFDLLRAMADADVPIACPKCGSLDTRRKLSLFSAVGSEGVIAGAGASCGSCSPSTSCATCGMRSSH